jgi:hypothetical protein
MLASDMDPLSSMVASVVWRHIVTVCIYIQLLARKKGGGIIVISNA